MGPLEVHLLTSFVIYILAQLFFTDLFYNVYIILVQSFEFF